ncbi:MAG: hypothetical protein K0R49_237 [Burkholderiales bacterium]|jgi:hypothetical protein|nr:hypothetical protein [Burkholderiales bacterium]
MFKKVTLLTSFFFTVSSNAAISHQSYLINDSPNVVTNKNAAFQAYQNEYNIGYGYSEGKLIDGAQNVSSYNTQSLNLELEHLFDMGVWFNVNFNMLTSNDQPNLGPLNGGNGSYPANPMYNNGAAFNQNPFVFTFQGKVGYAFNLISSTLQLTPYIMLGRNANWATSTVLANGSKNITEDYFYTGGIGARLSYKLNNTVLLYLDEGGVYNWDNSGAIKYIQTSSSYYGKSYAATNYGFNSVIGAKFNVYKSLQLGANTFWYNFQPQSNISGLMYTPTNIFGGEISIGLTY